LLFELQFTRWRRSYLEQRFLQKLTTEFVCPVVLTKSGNVEDAGLLLIEYAKPTPSETSVFGRKWLVVSEIKRVRETRMEWTLVCRTMLAKQKGNVALLQYNQ
jgi:hypothetical protein